MAILCSMPMALHAANPYLVKDINTTVTPGSGSPANIVVCNSVLYFTANTTAEGTELWRSDGTAAGTVVVKDINPGMSSSSPSNLTVFGSTVYFTANDGSNGTELWKTDGTAAGTVMVRDINVPPGSSSGPANMTPMGSSLYFTANDGMNGVELWKTDGTATGTVMVKDINPGAGSSSPGNLTAVGANDLLFTANDGVNGTELWRYVASSNQAILVKNINVSSAGSSYPSNFAQINYVLYFSATDGRNGYELWKSNGLASATTMASDIYAGTNSSNPTYLTVMGSYVYFRAYDATNGYALWRSNGTTTSMVPGSANSSPSNLTVMGSYLYFQGYDATYGYELWRTDGTTTTRLSDINPATGNASPSFLTVMGSYLYFKAYDPTNGYALWRTSGSTPTLVPGTANSSAAYLTVMGSYLYFQGYDASYGYELRRTDGVTTTLVKDINAANGSAGSSPANFLPMGSYVYFTANDGVNGSALWKSDGTTTTLVPGTANTSPSNLKVMGSYLYFQGYDATYGYELWRTDGTNTTRLSDIYAGSSSSSPTSLTVLGSYLYFQAYDATNGYALWRTGGSAPTLVPGSANSNPANLAVLGAYLFFQGYNATYGYELWRTDGTTTTRISDINPSTGSSSPAYLTALGSYLYFRAYDPTNGYAIWRTAGSTPTLVPGTANSSAAYLTAMGSYLYFQGYDATNGYELWRTDGTNTSLVKDVYPGSTASYPANLTVNGTTLYFTAGDGTHGSELWKSDGTTAGTALLKDIYPGSGGASISYLTPVGTALYFQANSPDSGAEMWRSDGTAAGTIAVGEIKPGTLGANPAYFTALNNKIYFQAQDPVYGSELFAFDTTYPAGTITANSGAGYVTSTSVTLNLTCSDPGGGCVQMQFSSDNLSWTTAEAFATTRAWTLPAGDGPKNIYVRYLDSSGNWSSPYLIRVVLDTTIPETYLLVYPPAMTTSNATTFQFTSLESATFECLLDDDPAGFQPCTSPKNYTLYAGTHQFRVRAIDPAGHIDATPSQYSWTIYDTLDGVAYGWGRNSYGIIGNGVADSNPHPVREQVPSPINFIQLSAGQWHSIALRNDGTVWGWGSGSNSQLGNAAYTSSLIPVQASGLANITAVAAGFDINLALKSDGTVWHWGSYINNAQTPILKVATAAQVSGVSNVIAIAAGFNHVMALKSDGTVWAWGQNDYGELGPAGTIGAFQATPIQVTGLSGVFTAIRAMGDTSYALRNDGTVWAWGSGGSGQLGNAAWASSATPLQVATSSGMTGITALATGGFGSHMLAIDASGYAWGWGANTYGQLGLGAGMYGSSYNVPQKVTGLSNVTAISTGSYFTLFLTRANSVWSAGRNYFGELGQGLYDSTQDHSVADKVGYLDGAFNIAAGGEHALALTTKWITSTVDANGGSPGFRSSIAVDANDNPHIGYVERWTGLRYMSSTNRTWNPYQSVDATLTDLQAVSMALDSAGKAHMCYQGKNNATGNYELRYATNAGGTWQTTTLVANATLVSDGNNCDIAYSRPSGTDTIYISYYSQTGSCGGLNLAKKAGAGSWSYYSIENGCPTASNYVGRQHSITVDAYDTVLAAYTANSALKYAEGNTSAWTSSVIDATSTEKYPSIAVMPATQNPAIAYSESYACSPLSCNKLKYAESDGSSWSSYTVDNYDGRSVGDSLALAFSKSGLPYISYHDATGDDLRIAIGTADRSVWRLNAVDTNNSVGYNSSIAVDSLNAAHISYFYATMGQSWDLKYATNLDADAPTGSVLVTPTATYGSTNYVKSTSVTLALTCDDGIGVDSVSTGGRCWQMKLSNDLVFNNDSPESFATSRSWALNSTNGAQTVYAKFRDSANNWSSVYSGSIFLDSVAPTGTLSISIPNYPYTNSQYVPLTTSCSDPGTPDVTASGCKTMEFSADNGATWNYSAPVASQFALYLPSGEGVKTIKARFYDKAGNVSLTQQQSVTLDQSEPSFGQVIITSKSNGITNNPAVTLSVNCSDTLSGCGRVEISNDKSSWASYTPVSYPSTISNWPLSLGDGAKSVYARFYDKAGNVTTLEIKDTVTLDTTSASGSVTINSGASFSKSPFVTLDLLCTDSSGFACSQVQFSYDAVRWSAPEAFDPAHPTRTNFPLGATNNQILLWGYNNLGQLGDGTQNSTPTPKKITSPGSDWVMVSEGTYHTAAIRSDGTLWTWGGNSYGQLGIGTTDTSAHMSPVQIGSDTDWAYVATGVYQTYAIKTNGTLWAWGNNSYGQLGCSTTTYPIGPSCALPMNAPQQVGSASDWAGVTGGYYHTVAMKTDRTLWTWGYNGSGQLGDGTTTPRYAPAGAAVAGGVQFLSFAAGDYHTLAVRTDGTLWSWGHNYYGQLGVGGAIPGSNATSPQQVGDLNSWSTVSAGQFHSLATRADGSLWSWGYNSDGQLGLGTSGSPANDQNTPQQVLPYSDWVLANAGNYHSMGLRSNGTLWGWGYNAVGPLGTGNTTASTVPLQASGNETRWIAADAGGYSTSGTQAADGTKMVYARFRDSAGNWSVPFSSSIVFDASSPGGSIAINNSTAYTNSTSLNLALTCNDATSGCKEMCISNSSDCSAWETFATSKNNWTIPSGDGSKTVSVWFRNNADDETAALTPATAVINLDTTAPSGTVVINSGAAFTRTDFVTLSVTCDDGTGWSGCSEMGISNDGTSWSSSEPMAASKQRAWQLSSGEGIKTVYLKLKDAAGNWTNTTVLSGIPQGAITYDKTPPNPPKVAGATPTKLSRPLWTWQHDAAGTSGNNTYMIRIDNPDTANGSYLAATAYTAPGDLADGWHTLYVSEYDAAGNLSAPGSQTVLIDTLPPNNPIVTGATPTNNKQPTWTWQSGGNGGNGTFICKLDSTDFTAPSAQGTITSFKPSGDLGDGAHILYVKELDAAGNESGATAYTITIDSQVASGPTVNGASPTSNKQPTWSWNQTLSGTFEYRFDNPDMSSGTTTTTLTTYTHPTPLPDGSYTLYVREWNPTGAWSGVGSKSIVVDTTPPDAPQVSGASPVNTLTPTWNWVTAGGGNGTFRYKLDSSDFNTGTVVTTTALTFTVPADAPLEEGAHVLYVQERDDAGNWSGSGAATVTIDRTAPAPPLVSATTPTTNTMPSWNWASGGGGSGWYRYKLGNSNFGVGATEGGETVFTPLTPMGDGPQTLYIGERDAAGNWSATASCTIVIDTFPPNPPIVTGTSPTANLRPTWSWSQAPLSGNGTFRYRLDNNDLTSGATESTVFSHTPQEDLPDGPHTLYLQERDDAGNWSGSGSLLIEVDTTAPAAPHLSGTSPVRTATPTWNWVPGGGGAGLYRYKLDDPDLTSGATETAQSAFTPSIAQVEGNHTLYLQEKDAAGNWSGIGNFEITIDLTAPTGGVKINNDAAYTNSWTVSLAISAQDASPMGQVQMQFCNADPVAGTCLSGWSAPEAYAALKTNWSLAAGEGSKRVNVRFIDAAGNQSADTPPLVFFDTITLDSIAPTGTLSVQSGAAYTKTEIASLVINGTDASPIDTMKIANADTPEAWAAASTETFSATRTNWVLDPTEGTKNVYVRLQDRSGLWSNAIASQPIILDKSAPTGTLNINNGATTTMATGVELQVSCTDRPTGTNSGCNQMRFSNDGATWSTAVDYPGTPNWDLSDADVGGSPADGVKTVFVQLRDSAGNWSSEIISKSITLDRAAPSGSVTINNAAANTTSSSVTLSLVCNDDTSGCATMEFKNDGSAWSAAEAFGASKVWSLSPANGTRTVSVRFSDRAGNTGTFTSSINLDDTPPTTTAGPNGSGDKATAVTVTLGCDDNGGSGCAATYYTLDGTAPTVLSTRYTAPISISGVTTPVVLNYFSVDNLGNQEPYKTETYSFISGYTTLTLDTPPTLLQNGLLDVSGKLTRYPDSQAVPNNDMDLSGLPVRLTVTGPSDSPCADGCVENTTTYTALGHYKFTGLNLFSFKGTYTIKADFLGTGLHQPSHSSTQSLLVGASAGYAIIVQGKVSGDAGLESHNKTTGRIYETLKERGFVDDNIMYFNYAGTVVPGVDAVPAVGNPTTANTIRWAVETWARERMNGSPAPLYVIFVDHGNNDTFYIDPDTIASADLNGWLNSLETNLLPVAKLEKRVIILGACYSGSFLDTLKQAPLPGTDAGRIVISSAAADEQSYKGPNEPDGIRAGEFFIEEFFKQLRKGFSIKAAFVEAAALTRTFTSQGSGSANSVNAYNDTAVQHPLLEDDGQGAGSNTLLDGIGDGLEAATMHLGFGVTNAALGPADLKAVSGTHYLAYSVSSTPTALWSEAYSNSAVSSAWFEIKAPSTTLSGTAGTNQLALNLPTGLMELKPSGRWEPVPAAVPTFPTAGKYEIYYFTKSTNQEISEMKRSLVYKNKQDNQKPSPFNLVSPGAGSVEEQTRTELNFVWDASIDPDGDSLTYTLQIATDETFTTVVYQREEIENSWFALDASAGLKDKTHYYWRVLAVDRYGEIRTSNQEWRFMTDDTNSLPAQIIGTVTDALGNPVAGAVVSAVLSGAVKAQASAGSGAYALLPSPGTYTVTASAPGFIDNQSSAFTVSSGSVYTVPKITLNPAQSTLQVSVSGSGQVYQSPAGAIDCTGSDTAATGCHTTVANGTPFSLVATAADWRSLFTSWSGVTCNSNDNTLSVCDFTLNSNTIVTAAFGPNYQAKLATDVQYASLQEALDAAETGTTVQVKAYHFPEAILFNRLDDAVITVEGGCVGAGYSPSVGGSSTVSGSLRIRQGALKIKGPVAVR